MYDVLLIVLAYLIGSIPFSFIVSKIVKAKDLRYHGSKTVGAMNVYRMTKSIPLTALAGLLDGSKGVIAALLANYASYPMTLVFLGMAVVIGHCFPIFLKFKGGRGVAASAGFSLVVYPLAVLVWLIIVGLFTALLKYKYYAIYLANLLTAIFALIYASPPVSYAIVGILVVISIASYDRLIDTITRRTKHLGLV